MLKRGPKKGYKQTKKHIRKRCKHLKDNQYAKDYKWTKKQRDNLNRIEENAPNYIDGRWIKQYYCMDCEKEISNQGGKRCLSCAASIKMKKRWQNPKFKKIKSKQAQQQWQNGRMDGIFKSPTRPEKEIMKILKKLKIDYIFQFRPKNYSRIYDFYILKLNLIVEFDGIYWHSLPGMKERDEEKTEYAKNNGYNLLRFNENNLNNFKNSILKIIKK